MKLNPEYQSAMQKFGEDSSVLDALRRGRDAIFVSEDKGVKGMSVGDIRKFLSDPNVSDAEKEMFRTGAARALRAKVLEPTSKKFTHNWADFINQPGILARMEALVDPASPASRQAWDLFRRQMGQEAKNFAQVARATQNSRTAPRLELQRELESASPGEMLGQFATSPKTSMIRGMLSTITPPSFATNNANRAAELLAARGARQQNNAVREIERLLDRGVESNRTFNRLSAWAPASAPYLWPYQE
jgi:hypothetical protein